MLIVLKGEHIEQKFYIIHRRFTQHIHMIINFYAIKIVKHFFQTVESSLNTITILIILTSRLITNHHVKLHLSGKTGHIIKTGTKLKILTDR